MLRVVNSRILSLSESSCWSKHWCNSLYKSIRGKGMWTYSEFQWCCSPATWFCEQILNPFPFLRPIYFIWKISSKVTQFDVIWTRIKGCDADAINRACIFCQFPCPFLWPNLFYMKSSLVTWLDVVRTRTKRCRIVAVNGAYIFCQFPCPFLWPNLFYMGNKLHSHVTWCCSDKN